MKNVLRYIYAKSFLTIIVTILMCIILWAVVNKMGRINRRYNTMLKYINSAVFLGVILIILYTTIVSRTTGEVEACIIPFYSFVMAQKQKETYRTMLMNVLLFVPFGITMPYVLKKSCGRKITLTILCAILYSLLIEIVQYRFCLGRAEIDDVICNTIGASIGCMSFGICNMIERKTNTI